MAAPRFSTALLFWGASIASACFCTPHKGNKSATLPNVLVIGDSISGNGTGYMDYLPEVLGGLANALQTGSVSDNGVAVEAEGEVSNKGPCGTSYGVIECVDTWLGDGGWDAISFNWGLHDICPKLYENVTRAEYTANMKQIIGKLRGGLAPGGKIVWVSTTPVPASYKNRNDSDVVDINQIMTDLIAFDDCCDDVVYGADLYHAVVDRCNRNATWAGYPQTSDCLYLQDNGVHFSELGKRFTAIEVAAHLLPYV